MASSGGEKGDLIARGLRGFVQSLGIAYALLHSGAEGALHVGDWLEPLVLLIAMGAVLLTSLWRSRRNVRREENLGMATGEKGEPHKKDSSA